LKKLDVTPESMVKINNETPAALTPEKKKENSTVLDVSNSKMLTPDPDAIDGESEE
jgi:hypothetical protein